MECVGVVHPSAGAPARIPRWLSSASSSSTPNTQQAPSSLPVAGFCASLLPYTSGFFLPSPRFSPRVILTVPLRNWYVTFSVSELVNFFYSFLCTRCLKDLKSPNRRNRPVLRVYYFLTTGRLRQLPMMVSRTIKYIIYLPT